MPKQKKPSAIAGHLRLLVNRRRLGWFVVLLVGLVLIQIAYNTHNGHARILGFATHITSSQLLDYTNNYRQTSGQSPLTLSSRLTQAAQAKAADMVLKNYWDHIAPDGSKPWTFLEHAGYSYQTAGENLAYGFSTGEEIIKAWVQSPTHQANLLGKYTEVGFGIAEGKNYQGGEHTVVVALYTKPETFGQATTNILKDQLVEPSQHIQGMSVVGSGGASWATYASLALVGAAAVGFVVTHLELLRLGWYRGKHFLALHPAFDAVVVVSLALLLVFTTGGFIR